MLEAFRRHLDQSGLIPEGAEVLVGFSGGADSTCLLHLLHRLGAPVVAAHLNHGQRENSAEEQKALEEWCARLEIPFVGGSANVPLMARDLGIGLEEAGRRARYQFFRSAASRLGCSLIATAHTKDDLVETMLLNMARGTGLAGLAGIPERRDGIIRPLLFATRSQTQAYCEEHGFTVVNDPANTDTAFSRARIRHRVMPELEAINPAVRDAMARLAGVAESENAFLDGMAAAALEKAEAPLNGPLNFLTLDCELCLRRDELLALPSALLARAIRLAARALGAELDGHQTKLTADGLAGGQPGSVTAEGGQVALAWDQDRLALAQMHPTQTFRFPLTVPGETISDEFGWQFVAAPAPEGTPVPKGSPLQALIDSGAVKGQLYFRSFQEGDLIQPLGMTGRKLVSDVLQEMRLSRAARARLPIICDMIGPLWIPGGPLADRVKVGAGSHSLLLLRFEPVADGQGT